MVKYLNAEEARSLWCPKKECHCIVDKCHAWEWATEAWPEKEEPKGFCALCHKEGV